MTKFWHRLVAGLGALAAILPTADQLPSGTPRWLRTIVTAIGAILLLSADKNQVLGRIPADESKPPGSPPDRAA